MMLKAFVAKKQKPKKNRGIYYNYSSCSPWLRTPRANKQGDLQFSAASRSTTSTPCSSIQTRKIQYLSRIKSRYERKRLSLPPSKLLLHIRAHACTVAASTADDNHPTGANINYFVIISFEHIMVRLARLIS